MSILIESMEMPKSCPCELLRIGYDLYCSFVGEIPARVKEYYECCQNDTRPSWCPLSPVPPHGRLIDADTLYEDCALDCKYEIAATTTRVNEYIQLKIDAAPTVIPAE